MKKYIHYCWFGGKPLPKLAKKCIKSWEKYLPDFEIKLWNEENTDLNECAFVKGAYENKKWAFVADYVRTKALYEYGGIYFDTDMEVTKDISDLLKNDTFLGIEDSGFVAVGVWYEKNKNAILPKKLYEKYKSMNSFPLDNLPETSIPKMISNILDDYGLEYKSDKIQTLDHNIVIYPRDYFYPFSYDRTKNVFTDNTCMIHYYDASWIPLKERIELYMVRKLGLAKTFAILDAYRAIKNIVRKIAKVILYPVLYCIKQKQKRALITEEYLNKIEKVKEDIQNYKNKDYIVIHNGDWLGVTSATIELFENRVNCAEIYRKKDAQQIADTIMESNIKQVIFSSFAIGYKDIVTRIKKKNPSIKIKTYWHGSHSQILDKYGWERNTEIINLHKKGYVDVMASCKYSLQDFYKKEGFNSYFLTNKVTLPKSLTNLKVNNNKKEIRLGLYAAKCDDWRKNMYSQIAAAALIENAVIDMVPLNESAKEFASILGVKIEGCEKGLPREELIKRMANNTVNLYVTFSECAPMLPLESFEVNVPCITGNNHHYFMNSKLDDLIVVKNEENPNEIKDKILNCINKKDLIMKEYATFKKNNLDMSKKQVKEFIEM